MTCKDQFFVGDPALTITEFEVECQANGTWEVPAETCFSGVTFLSKIVSFANATSYFTACGVCKNGATCGGEDYNPKCVCLPGWTGEDCSETI